tara:strand:+ start:701 stop:910 length:210 start_codon:yes stop_codon:yes gene_type:complete
MVTPFDPPVPNRSGNRDTTLGSHPDPDTDIRQALQELIHAAKKAEDFLPGGIPEASELREAIIQASRWA